MLIDQQLHNEIKSENVITLNYFAKIGNVSASY